MNTKIRRFLYAIGLVNNGSALAYTGYLANKISWILFPIKIFLISRYFLLSRYLKCEITMGKAYGKNLVLSHASGITINPSATIGDDCTLFKGSTIGSIRSGLRRGVPVIGNRVVIGLNSTVVGGITIGDDVMIAPNSFVNFDVPSNSLVIGSPGVIKRKDTPTTDYLQKVW